MNDIKLKDVMRSADVSRWHTVNVAKRQSVAEHQYLVAILAVRLVNECSPEAATFERTFKVMMAAMLHDAHEVDDGDRPAPSKAVDPCPDNLLGATIWVADAIEAYHWINDNAVGVYSRSMVVSDCRARMQRRSLAVSDQYGMEFHEAVRRVLKELGL
jgi:hypothetical protein